MHNGQIGGYDKVRRALDLLIPDELYPYRQGTTDSELMFFLLFRHGLEHNPAEALERTVAEILAVTRAAGITEPFRMTTALSDGARTWAVRFATDDDPPSLYWRADLDDLMIVSEPLDSDAEQWNRVPPGHLLVAEAGVEVSAQKFKVS
jgi:predicted glutamine amidotransferase